ncbi:MAG: SpoIID/LytB domain-containing protein [Actinobacteria bacterium]|nr:SpoIID/LytB domain-containing protein [Actinomycetota bacterium]
MSRLIIAVTTLAAVLLVPGQPPALAQEPPAGQITGPIRLIPASPDAAIRLNGTHPPNPDVCPARQPRDLHAAYDGVLEIGLRSNGQLYLVAELTFPEYLNGIAEVPRDWPMDALKAQVVAARTYAMDNLGASGALAEELNYDLCSTDACQVYRGLQVKDGPWGDRWKRAVSETAGEILEYQGRPASTVYFSTSNGQTYSNAEVFGSDPLPYLKSVPEEDDGESPVSRWEVRMPMEDLTEALRLGGWWEGPPIETVEQQGENVVMSGGGQSESMSLSQLRLRLNAQGTCLVPKRYPTTGPEGRTYPQVIPSKWMTVAQQDGDLVATGRGWGHGAGMVQWGAKGKADRGMDYAEILGYYYGGLQPVTREEPGRIRVGLAANLDKITIERVGEITVEGIQAPEGTFKILGGETLAVQPVVDLAPKLELNEVQAPGEVAPTGAVPFSFDLSAPANVQISYLSEGGEPQLTEAQPLNSGRQEYEWAPAEDLEEPGDYEVRVVADDGVDRVESQPLLLSIAAGAMPSPEPSPETQAAGGGFSPSLPIALGVGGVVLVAAAALGVYVRRQPRGRRSID